MASKHRHNIAIQEAGHAVIARIFGLRVTRVRARSIGDAQIERETAAFLAENSDVPTQIAAYEKDAIVALAGNAANRVEHPHLPHFDVMTDDSVDMTNARQAIYKIVCVVTGAWPMPQGGVLAIPIDAVLQTAMTRGLRSRAAKNRGSGRSILAIDPARGKTFRATWCDRRPGYARRLNRTKRAAGKMIAQVRARALHALIPPPRLALSTWIEANIRLPEGVSAQPGPVRLWPYQREIADAISDPEIERISLVKPVRVGFTTLLTAAIGSYVANEPAPILVLLPTEADARDFVVSDVEPTFGASPALRGALADDAEEGERNTLLSRRFPGDGSLKIVAARAPRNLRRHTARILIVDEADACEAGPEGNPIRLGERRTFTFANRKIIIGSTPIFADTSAVLRAYGECPCPECGTFSQIAWAHIEWPEDQPEAAAFRCPSCKALIDERHKPAMVAAGQWRAMRPDVKGHAGFRLNALVSLLANASWGRLAQEFLAAKDDPSELQVFTNTILAEGWSTPAMIDDATLAARAEEFDLNNIPPEVLTLEAGCDVQDDRCEITVTGWTRTSVCLVLGHSVIWSSFQDAGTWDEVDELLRTRWRHPWAAS